MTQPICYSTDCARTINGPVRCSVPFGCECFIPSSAESSPEPSDSVHFLKTWPDYFDAVEDGRKTFEIRKNDRNFQVGDTLVLEEFVPIARDRGYYTGRKISVCITYMTDFDQKNGNVVLGIET